MTSKIGLYRGHVGWYRTEASDFLINHQKWQVSCYVDHDSGLLVFHLQDPHKIAYTTTEFVVENVDHPFKEKLIGLKTSEEQQALINEYLQARLCQANPYQIHIESHHGQKIIRFGQYGLLGGINILGLEINQRLSAIVCSIIQVGIGVYLREKGQLGGFCGGVLMSSGVCSGLYAAQKDKTTYKTKEYVKKIRYGVLTGLVFGSAGGIVDQGVFALQSSLIPSLSTLFKITSVGLRVLLVFGGQMLITSMKSALSITCFKMIQKKGRLNVQDSSLIAKKALIAGVSGTADIVGMIAAIAFSSANNSMISLIMRHNPSMNPVRSYITASMVISGELIKHCTAGAFSLGSIKVVANLCDNYLDEESITAQRISRDVKTSALIGGSIGAFIGSRQLYRYYQIGLQASPDIQALELLVELSAGVEEPQLIKKCKEKTEEFEQDVNRFAEDMTNLQKVAAKLKILLEARIAKGEPLTEQEHSHFLEVAQTMQSELNLLSQRDNLIRQNMAQFKQQTEEQLKSAKDFLDQLDTVSLPPPGLFEDNLDASFSLGEPTFSLEELFVQLSAGTYIDCNLEELIPHVVLVQALTNNVAYRYPEFRTSGREDDEPYKVLCCIKAAITSAGLLGYHLESGRLPKRPSLHWSWNQLVQPHRPPNDWEDAKIAMLEPLATFENTADHKPLGIAPYDTFTLGSHRLSAQSIILVPSSIEAEARDYLREFSGHVIAYEGSLRAAISDVLQEHYPQIWPVCDKKGHLVGRETKRTAAGFAPVTYLKKPDGQIVIVIKGSGEGEQPSRAIRAYQQTGRHVGLHVSSPIILFEDRPYFYLLQKIEKRPEKLLSSRGARAFLFASEINTMERLIQFGTLEAIGFCKRAIEHDRRTGIEQLASQLVMKAIYADLISIYYEKKPGAEFTLSPFELKLIVHPSYDDLSALLDHIQNEKLRNPTQAFDLLMQYRSILELSILKILQAKEQVTDLLTDEGGLPPPGSLSIGLAVPLCLLTGQVEWGKVYLPNDISTVDLERRILYNRPLGNYCDQIMLALPTGTKDLKMLYHQISSRIRETEELDEQYRLKVICATIRWSLLQKIYSRAN